MEAEHGTGVGQSVARQVTSCAAGDQFPTGMFLFSTTKQQPIQLVKWVLGYVKLTGYTVYYSARSRMHSALSKPKIQ